MIGAIIGDIIGSVYEHEPIKTTDFPLFSEDSCFTDDSVLTVAVADSILSGIGYVDRIKYWARRYPAAGFGGRFYKWMFSTSNKPYNSWGNGSAMRVSPIGFAFDTLETVLEEAAKSAEVTHNHPEGVKGAQAVAVAIFMARMGKSKDDIKDDIQVRFSYNLDRTLDQIRPGYQFDVSCQGSVPESIIAFLESSNYETAVRNAISLGGDTDTMACIAGAIAEAYYKEIPSDIIEQAKSRLSKVMQELVDAFYDKFKLYT